MRLMNDACASCYGQLLGHPACYVQLAIAFVEERLMRDTTLVVPSQIPAGPAVMRLIHVDLFAVDREVFHVASKGR